MILALILSIAASSQGPGRTLDGTVTDVLGGHIVDAAVRMRCEAETVSTRSDLQGSFQFRNLPPERCTIEVDRALFATARLTVDLTSRESAHVPIVLDVKGLETEVVVTSTRGDEERVFDVPASTTVITAGEIGSRPHRILPQVLDEETGILVQQTTSAQGSPIIRGFTGQRNVMLFDGIRFNTSAWRVGPSQYLSWISPAVVDRLEVVRGPGSVLYGSDALGGTIHIRSVQPSFSPSGLSVSGAAEASVGSADLGGSSSGLLLVAAPRLAARVGGGHQRVGDLRPGQGLDSHAAVTRFLGLPSTAIGGRLRSTGFSQTWAHLAGAVRAGASGAVTASYYHDTQSKVSRYDRTLGGEGLFRSDFEPQRLDLAYVRYERGSTGPFDRLSAAISLNRQSDGTVEQARPSARVDRQRSVTTVLGYQAQGLRHLRDRHSVTLGVDVHEEFISASRWIVDSIGLPGRAARPEIPDGTRYGSLGLFTQGVSELVRHRLWLRGGARYGRFTFRTTPDAALGVDAERISTDALTFNTGLVVGVNRVMNATFAVGRGFRAANASDLGAVGVSGGGGFEISPSRALELGALIGSTDGPGATSTGRPLEQLGPESLYSFEAGLRLRTRRLAASVTAFDLELVDTIQRRTAIFPRPVAGMVISGHEIIRQDEAGRAFAAIDPRPIATRVNVDRARIVGAEAEATARLGLDWLASAHFSLANGREGGSGAFLRRMPPRLGGVRIRWEPHGRGVWLEGVTSFAWAQTRLSQGDLSDPRIGGRRDRNSIAAFFNGTATDLGLVRDGLLAATGETLAQVQARVLGTASAAALSPRTAGFFVVGARGGFRLGPHFELTVIAENITDRNYRRHGSGVDAPGFNLQLRTRYLF